MKKVTVGFVVQDFNDKGKCTSQDFIAGDEVSWEDEYGDPETPPKKAEHFPFHMVQPK